MARILRQPSDILTGDLPLRDLLSIGSLKLRAHNGAVLCASLRGLSLPGLSLLVLGGVCFSSAAFAQAAPSACTTQSAMSGELRQTLADSALAVASAIKAGDADRVRSMSTSDIASNFDATAFIVHQTSSAISGDTLRVTQLYRLDASARKAGDTTEADFGCPLSGSTNEVDFSIPGLPPGIYAFAIVEANGDRPWLLPMLLEQQGGSWKMAGFYPHPRTAGGHDGLWFWTTARADVKAGKKWLAWVLYGQADQLLRPANFVTSTHLDQLRSERHNNAPGELSDGIGPDNPVVIRAKDNSEFRFTSLGSIATDDGKGVDLVVRYRADSALGGDAGRTRNVAAAAALLTAHPELREGFSGVSVFAETPGQTPFATELSFSEIH